MDIGKFQGYSLRQLHRKLEVNYTATGYSFYILPITK